MVFLHLNLDYSDGFKLDSCIYLHLLPMVRSNKFSGFVSVHPKGVNFQIQHFDHASLHERLLSNLKVDR